MNNKAHIKRTVFGTGLGLLFLNIVQGIKAFNETFEALTKFLGSIGINVLHLTTLVGLFAGLGVLATTFIKYRKTLRQSWKYLLFGTIITVGTGANLVWTELRTPEPRLNEKVKQWCKEIQSSVATNGAFPVSKYNPITQVWTDAQLLKGLLIHAKRDRTLVNGNTLRGVFEWIESQRRTNVNGWTYFSECRSNEPSLTEITGWVLVAELESLDLEDFWVDKRSSIEARIERDARELLRRQHPSGGFTPILSGELEYCRTYSTLMALHALAEFKEKTKDKDLKASVSQAVHKGIAYLVDAYNTNIHSWVPNPQRPQQYEQFPGLTAQVLYVLSECDRDDFAPSNYDRFIIQCQDFIKNREITGYEPSRNQRMHDTDQHIHSDAFASCFQLEASTYLGYPWIVATLSRLQDVPALASDRDAILNLRASFLGPETLAKGVVFVEHEYFYVWAENLIGYGTALATQKTEKVNLLASQFGFKLALFVFGIAAGALIGRGLEKGQPKTVISSQTPEPTGGS